MANELICSEDVTYEFNIFFYKYRTSKDWHIENQKVIKNKYNLAMIKQLQILEKFDDRIVYLCEFPNYNRYAHFLKWMYHGLVRLADKGEIPEKYKPVMRICHDAHVKRSQFRGWKPSYYNIASALIFYKIEFKEQLISYLEQKFTGKSLVCGINIDLIVDVLKDINRIRLGCDFDIYIENWKNKLINELFQGPHPQRDSYSSGASGINKG